MFEWLKSRVNPDVDTVIERNRQDARLRAIEHGEAAAHHAALARMYADRADSYARSQKQRPFVAEPGT